MDATETNSDGPVTRIHTAVDGIDWPVVPSGRGAAVLSLLYQLDQSQWWPPARLRAAQFAQLERLLDHCWRTVPFYRDRLNDGGWKPGGAPAAEVWSGLPVLRRQEVQEADGGLCSVALPASHGATRETYTSGSTGRPLRVLRSQVWQLFWSAFTLRDHLWQRRDLSGKLAAIRESGRGKAVWPDGSRAPRWGRSTAAVFESGPFAGLNVLTPVEHQAEWLMREDPDYLLTHPSIAENLARYCLEAKLRPSRLRGVQTIAEVLGPTVRALCAEAWGVPVVDMYTSREAGYLALQCPEGEHYHVQAEGILVELLDEDGRECAPGDIGRVIVTPLHNFAMPLVRYDIGDYAEVGEPCGCGRGLPVIRRILGRRQNSLQLPDGGSRWPLLSSSDIAGMLRIAPVRQYQFVQQSLAQIEFRVVVAQALSAKESAALADWARTRFGDPFAVTVVQCDEIPRGPGGKFQDFVSEIPQ